VTPPAVPATPVGGGGPSTADLVAVAVLSVRGVTGLHGGAFGEVGTYLPGRRISGIRLGEPSEVHLTVAMDSDVLAVAGEVRDTISTLLGGRVEVFVEDITPVARR
jgi:hypothetical protein